MDKLFIFDMGRVLVTNLTNLQNIASLYNLDYTEFRAFYDQYDNAIMEGRLDSMEFFALMGEHFGLEIKENLFITQFFPQTNHFILSIIDALKKKGHRCVLGSNTYPPHMEKVGNLEEKPLLHLDALYESWRMGIAKPSPLFFRYILEKEGVEAKDVVFIDDKLKNVEAARGEGITAFQYNSDDNGKAMDFFSSYLK